MCAQGWNEDKSSSRQRYCCFRRVKSCEIHTLISAVMGEHSVLSLLLLFYRVVPYLVLNANKQFSERHSETKRWWWCCGFFTCLLSLATLYSDASTQQPLRETYKYEFENATYAAFHEKYASVLMNTRRDQIRRDTKLTPPLKKLLW